MTFQCRATAPAAPGLMTTVCGVAPLRWTCVVSGWSLVPMSWPPMNPFVWQVCVDRLTRMSLASREPAPPWVSMIAPARSPAWQRGVRGDEACSRQRAESERHGSLQAVGGLTLTATSANDHPRPPRLGAADRARAGNVPADGP